MLNTTLIVIAYPPRRHWWQLWKPNRPFMLNLGECHIDNLSGIAHIYKPKNGYIYRMANLIDTELGNKIHK